MGGESWLVIATLGRFFSLRYSQLMSLNCRRLQRFELDVIYIT